MTCTNGIHIHEYLLMFILVLKLFILVFLGTNLLFDANKMLRNFFKVQEQLYCQRRALKIVVKAAAIIPQQAL